MNASLLKRTRHINLLKVPRDEKMIVNIDNVREKRTITSKLDTYEKVSDISPN